MSWLEVVRAVADVGVMVVICAVFIVRSNKDRQEQANQNKILFDTMMNHFTDLFDKMTSTQQTPHVLTEDEDKTALEIDKVINTYLQNIVVDTGANRAMVTRYHNGGRDMAAVPFLKMSVTNEIVNVGNKPYISQLQNQFRSMLMMVRDSLDAEGECYITDAKGIKNDDVGTYEFLRAYGIRSAYFKALKNQNGYVIGFIVVFFNETNSCHENQEKIDHILQDKANQISALLCIKE